MENAANSSGRAASIFSNHYSSSWLQQSTWTNERSVIDNIQDNALSDNERNSQNSEKCHRLASGFTKLCCGLLLGGLLGSIALATILTIQLKTSKSTLTTTTATSTTATTATTATTTTSTATSTTTSTKTTTSSTTTTTTTTTTSTTTTTTTTAAAISAAYWTFNNNPLELYNGLDGTLVGGATYSTSLLGYGAALSLTQSSNQYVSITSKPLPLDRRSFTIEAWIYPVGFTSGDYGIFGQCQTHSPNLCFHFISRNNKLYCGFFNSDVNGITTLAMNTWSHVACVYNIATSTQQVWLNGVLDGSRSASPYASLWGTTTIGATFNSGSPTCFNGYIDQVRFVSRAKNATELLIDASLYVYHSFDAGFSMDNGPNGINSTAFGSVVTISGRVNQAVRFSGGSYVSYSYSPFYFLGIRNHTFSISLWCNPNTYAESTLVFAESKSNSWCVHFMVMNSSGIFSAHLWNGADVPARGPRLPLNTWTHIGYTYSSSKGLQLYINGSLYSTTGSFTFIAAGTPIVLTIGSDHGQTTCSPSTGGPFTGGIDEFYVYNREITPSEVRALANP